MNAYTASFVALLMIPMTAAAETTEVFRLSTQPDFLNSAGATVHIVDAMNVLTQRLSVGLPPNKAEAVQIATQRLNALTPLDKQAMRIASTARIRAAEYQIIKTPAIVFDGKAVLYGMNDVEQARAMYRAWRAQQGE